jgi:MFS family permease
VIYAMQPAIVGELTPLEQRGGLLAIGTAIWSLAGVVAPVVMGHLIDAGRTAQGYQKGFVVAGLVALTTGLIGALLMQPEKTRAKLAAAAHSPI